MVKLEKPEIINAEIGTLIIPAMHIIPIKLPKRIANNPFFIFNFVPSTASRISKDVMLAINTVIVSRVVAKFSISWK